MKDNNQICLTVGQIQAARSGSDTASKTIFILVTQVWSTTMENFFARNENESTRVYKKLAEVD